jgi:integrase
VKLVVDQDKVRSRKNAVEVRRTRPPGERPSPIEYPEQKYDGAAPIVGHSDAKRRIDSGMANELHCHADDFARGGSRAFVIHDLRRTVRTRLAKLKVDFITSELILGHALTGIHAVYDVHKYEDEKRAALQAWADHLQGIVGNGVQGNLFNNGNAEARL